MSDKLADMKDFIQKDEAYARKFLEKELCIYIIDLSSSMCETMSKTDITSKLEATKRAVILFIEQRLKSQQKLGSKDQLAVITVPEYRTSLPRGVLIKPSEARESYIALINSCTAGGSTPLARGMQTALEMVAESALLVRLVIVSDGVPDNATECLRIAGELAEEGAIVDTIGIPSIYSSSYDASFLEELSQKCNGQFVEVTDVAGFEKLLLASESDRRETTQEIFRLMSGE